jgi:hypothetical protein
MPWLSGQATIASSREAWKKRNSQRGLEEDTREGGVRVIATEVATAAPSH